MREFLPKPPSKLKQKNKKQKTHRAPPGEEEQPAPRVGRESGQNVEHLELVDEAGSLQLRERDSRRESEPFFSLFFFFSKLSKQTNKKTKLTTKHAETATILLAREILFCFLLPTSFTSLPSATTSKTRKRSEWPASRFHRRAHSSP